jgi:ribonucleoside-diphosphate reductase alpha chain
VTKDTWSDWSPFARDIALQKYCHTLRSGRKETWSEVAKRVATNVLAAVDAPKELVEEIAGYIENREFMPGGRYLYASGRGLHQTQNCLLLKADDSREGWSDLMQKSAMALMTGAGIGVVYSDVRPEGAPIRRTGGAATGPCALMQMVNEAGRFIMQGGARRCLPAETMVTMADFTKKPIKDVKVGDMVHTRFGSHKVTNVFDQGVQPVVKIETKRGTVYSTKNHKWLSANSARTKTFYTPTGSLSLDSKLYNYPTPTPGGEEIDTAWAYTLGYFLGDGCAYSSNRTHEITFQFANRGYNQSQVNLVAEVMEKMGSNPVTRKGHGDCTELRCRSKALVDVFQKYKTPNTEFVVPEEIKGASLAARYAFVAGWMDADGYFGDDSWKLANKWQSTRKDLMSFLADLGFVCTENGEEVRFCNFQREYFQKTVGKYHFKKCGVKPVKKTSEIPSDIVSISNHGECSTFDIEVEEVHEFIADGFVSHNSAIWAGLSWSHPDAIKFATMKNWSQEVRDLKAKDYNFPAPMDGTNVSVILDDMFFKAYGDKDHRHHSLAHNVYWTVVRQMLSTAEPGFSVDVGENAGENLRNACTEITSRDDSDICNLGSINMARITSTEHFLKVMRAATAFLLAGTIYSDIPYAKVDEVRRKNRRLGLGLMGIHEWLLKKGKKYGPDSELEEYLQIYATSTEVAAEFADQWGVSRPIKTRAIAPTGTIGIVAETTTGAEPMLCAAYKRRYLKGNVVNFQYVIDPAAKRLVDQGVRPEDIEDAYSLSENVERRVEMQAWLQKFVDHAISSTINLPPWGSEGNNDSRVQAFGTMLIKYLPGLRGITCYPDGCRGGQPLTPVKFSTAIKHVGEVYEEYGDVCSLTKGGTCGS